MSMVAGGGDATMKVQASSGRSAIFQMAETSGRTFTLTNEGANDKLTLTDDYSMCHSVGGTGVAQVCDINNDGAYTEMCVQGAMCLPTNANNGGCGTGGQCGANELVR